jgi:lipoic acid synthetase
MPSTPDRFHRQQLPEPAMARKPEWLKVKLPQGEGYERVRAILKRTGLATVCQQARCPNMGECWGGGTATVMLMGEICTRGCRFCHVRVGHPKPLDSEEPEHLGRAARELQLKYLVVTSVDRDDLPDGGASHFARAIAALRRECPELIVEVLIPDFQGQERDLDTVAAAGPHIIGHNVETVERLQPTVRDKRAGYRQSLGVLGTLKQRHGVYTKSSLMLGLGETETELLTTLADLRRVGVDVVTLGQYLQPSPFHLKVEHYFSPEEFAGLQRKATALGFLYVAAGPLVRSSYRAAEFFLRGLMQQKPQGSGP